MDTICQFAFAEFPPWHCNAEGAKMIYWLSAGDEITGVSGEWDRFAIENGGPEALADMVVGHSLWSFVQGVPTRRFLSEIFHACRHSCDDFVMPYRCDGKGSERLFSLHVIPEDRGVLRVEHRILRVRPAFAGTLPKAVEAASYRQCSICLSGHLGEHWMAPGRLIRMPEAAVTYVVCPACRAATQVTAIAALEGPRFA
jgi:hypothetical protein